MKKPSEHQRLLHAALSRKSAAAKLKDLYDRNAEGLQIGKAESAVDYWTNVPVVEVAKRMFAGTPFESILNQLAKTVATASS
jgi:hypothetical protein